MLQGRKGQKEMIRVEQVVTPFAEQWEAIIRGMRNPMNSWDRTDSYTTPEGVFVIGDDDYTLMEKLTAAGSDHRKFLRMIGVFMDITAPLYWWKEFKTYRAGRKFADDEPDLIPDEYLEYDIEMNSCSTMHKIHEKEFVLDDFSHEHLVSSAKYRLADTILALNEYREIYLNWDNESEFVQKQFGFERKTVWWQMIQMLPSSFNQKRTVMLNYEVLRNMYHARKNHKLDEWRDFCRRIEGLPYSDLITR